MSLARNLLELLPIAVEAVRQAFRGGVLTYTTAKELEPQSGLDESWSLAVPRDSGLADGERIEQLCVQLVSSRRASQNDIPGRRISNARAAVNVPLGDSETKACVCDRTQRQNHRHRRPTFNLESFSE